MASSNDADPPKEEVAPSPPYNWMDSQPPSDDTLEMWKDVAQQLEKNQTGKSVTDLLSSWLKCGVIPCFTAVFLRAGYPSVVVVVVVDVVFPSTSPIYCTIYFILL